MTNDSKKAREKTKTKGKNYLLMMKSKKTGGKQHKNVSAYHALGIGSIWLGNGPIKRNPCDEMR